MPLLLVACLADESFFTQATQHICGNVLPSDSPAALSTCHVQLCVICYIGPASRQVHLPCMCTAECAPFRCIVAQIMPGNDGRACLLMSAVTCFPTGAAQ